MVRSVYDALQRGADNQVSGVLGTLQGAVAQINTPEMMWVFSRDGCPLDLNDPEAPAVLTVATNPTTVQTLSPLCSLVITVATKLMNQPGKAPSFVLLDEAPTIFIPHLETIPNTGRSNKIATVLMCQDLAQLADGYGDKKADVLFAACNSHFTGVLHRARPQRCSVVSSARRTPYLRHGRRTRVLYRRSSRKGRARECRNGTFTARPYSWNYR